jgi:phage tail sheath gpL-like
MSISFDLISTNLRTHGVFTEFSNARAVSTAPDIPSVALIIGQRLAAGTVAAEVPVSVPSADAGEEYFGHGSILAHMIDYFKDANPYTELWAVALDDEGAGTAATGTFVFSGTATDDGVVYTYIGGERITTAVTLGDAAATVGAAVVADITAYVAEHNLPVSAAGTSTVTITCLHKGTLGNYINLAQNLIPGEGLPAGITCVITQVGSVIAGATDPDVADAITAIGGSWFQTIISAYADDTNHDKLEAMALSWWHPYEQKDTSLFIGAIGNQAALTALGNARNSQFTVLMGGGLSSSPPWAWAAVTGAVDAYESDPARPRQTLTLTGLRAPAQPDIFTQTERNTLLYDGVSTFTVGTDGTCYIERLITTYQTNALGVADSSYLNQTTMRTLAALRYTWNAWVALRFPRAKLADDTANVPTGQSIVQPKTLTSEALAWFRWCETEKGWVENWEQFKDDLLIERDSTDKDRVNMRMSPDLMNQFRVLAGQIQYLL